MLLFGRLIVSFAGLFVSVLGSLIQILVVIYLTFLVLLFERIFERLLFVEVLLSSMRKLYF